MAYSLTDPPAGSEPAGFVTAVEQANAAIADLDTRVDVVESAPGGGVTEGADLSSTGAADGHVLTADGAGGVAWEAPPAGGGGAVPFGATLYVSPTGSDANSGLLPAVPKLTIAGALSALNGSHDGIGTIRLRDNATYTLLAGVTLEGSRQRIIGAPKATIDASALTSGAAVTIRESSATTPPYYGGVCPISDVTLIGPGEEESDVVGIRFNQATDPGVLAHLSMRDLRIADFGVGIDYSNRAFCITAFNLAVHSCGRAVQVLAGGTNYGERITFIGCTFFNNPLHIYARGGGTGIHLSNCSLDYGGTKLDVGQGARAHLENCHVEDYDVAEDPFMVIDSDQFSAVTMVNGELVMNGSTAVSSRPLPAIIDNDGRATFTTVFMSNLRTAADLFADGTGRTVVTDSVIPANAEMASALARGHSLALSTLYADNAEVLDPWWVWGDSATTRLTGTKLTISSSTTHVRTGGRSVAMTKTAAVDGQAIMFIPVREDAMLGWEFWYGAPASAAAGTSYMTVQWATNVALKPEPVFTLVGDPLSQFAITKTQNVALSWTRASSGGLLRRAPSGVTHLAFVWNSSQFTSGALYFDDINVSQW